MIPKYPDLKLDANNITSFSIAEIGIPCMFYRCTEDSSRIMIYFHANAEDAGLSDEIIYPLKEQLNVHILVPEYPGYGVYNNDGENKPTITASEEQINKDAQTIYQYLTTRLVISEEQIHVIGRSLGSGPATFLASCYNPKS